MMSSLPKLSGTRYNTTLPISKQKITFRPFMVKEEKHINTAKQTGNSPLDVLETLVEVVNECVNVPNDFDARKLDHVDFRYLVMKIRNQSKGSELSGKVTCRHEDCGHKNDVHYDFEESLRIQNEDTEQSQLIELEDGISALMKFPTVENIIHLAEKMDLTTDDNIQQKAESDPNMTEYLMAASIEQIVHGEESFTPSFDELVDYIDSQFTIEHKERCMKFLQELPTIEIDMSFTCSKCNRRNDIVVRGDTDFLG